MSLLQCSSHNSFSRFAIAMWPFSSDSNAQPASPPGFNFEADARKFELSFQMETMANLMNSISKSCAKKCLYKHEDGELEVAEMACADRCVTKFMQAQNLVKARLEQQNMNNVNTMNNQS